MENGLTFPGFTEFTISEEASLSGGGDIIARGGSGVGGSASVSGAAEPGEVISLSFSELGKLKEGELIFKTTAKLAEKGLH